MDYSGYSNYDCSTEGSQHGEDAATVDEPDGSGTKNPGSHFDLLSFFATALQRDANEEEKWTTLVFLSIHLGPWNMFQPWNVYSGTSFSVTLLSRKFLIRQTVVDLDYLHSVRGLLAVKTPKLRPEDQSSHNSEVLRSLAKEYLILKTEPLAKHENIVTAYGCSWQTLPTGQSQPTPTLIMEGTKLGDLSNFSRERSLTLRERLRLCMDITSGLDALHTHGVIHGDLKPNNILVFNSWGRGYTAKLADFGSAVLFSETTFPCRAPLGTKVYRAPECADESVRLGRDDLVKTDLFSLGVTLAFLLVGSHIVDDIAALSGSDLHSLKEENQFAAWIIAHCHDDSAHIVLRMGSSDWVEDLSWNENSVFADHNLYCWFMSLCDSLLAADARQRPESVKVPARVLEHMLLRHLQMLLPRSSEATSKADGFATSSTSAARMAALMRMSKARYRKLTGERVLSETRISKVETIAIAHCCIQPGSYLKEAKFIIERNTGRKFKLKRRSKKWHTKSAFSKPRGKRALISAGIVRLANKMQHYVEESINGEVQQLMDLKIVSLQRAMFKPSQESNIFWMLPRPVMELLESQLLQYAANPRNTDADRADAAYEYATVILNGNDPTEARIDSALEHLTFAARNGQVEAQASVGRLSDVFGRPLEASRNEEMEWLLTASRAGSATAQRRLRDLDINGFTAAMRDIRRGNGATCPLLNQALLVNSRWVEQTGALADIVYGCLHESAITGNVGLLELPPELPSGWYECENGLGETPLVVACRGGQTAVVEILLARGANAAHRTAHGVTPLHFLAAFDDDDIPGVASSLLQHGADVEMACERELTYKELFDSPFGHAGGTPLLWAVAAGNHCAVRALLALGADPFAIERHPPGFSRYDFRQSPVTCAVVLHQLNLLETIVSALGDDCDVRKRFITECAGPHSQGYQALAHAIDCHPAFRVREYILHGREYQSVASSCVSLLVESGVDPIRFLAGRQPGRHIEITHPIAGACTSSNTGILSYLWRYQNGILRPTPKLWVSVLSMSAFEGLTAVFDFLIDRRDDVTADVSSDVRAVVKTLSLTKDPYFTIGVLRLIQGPGTALPPEDAFHIFFAAVTMGHFEVARQVQETQNISLTKRTGGDTLLYGLIAMSYDFPNTEPKISFILSLSPNKNTLFWNIGYLEGTGVTALQCAAYMPTEKCPASPGVFATVLEHFSEPKYLNAQLKDHPRKKSGGFTALHLAVRGGNFNAVARLVETPGIETNLQSSRGETPLDICVNIAQHYQMEEQMSSQVDKAQKNRSAVNMSILDLLINAENEGQIAKYSTLLLRRTEDEFTLVDAIKGKLYGVKLRVKIR
ncbi:Fc.00g024890.m01.CDS01 [Cosmosporella sp. VM-42]